MNPRVSVIIPCYNVERTVQRCLQSVFNQSYHPIEVICVNDASPDGTLDLLKQYQDQILLVDKPVNEGLGMARNSGLEVATGRYVFFLDSDDEIKPDTIAMLVSHIQDADVCLGSFERVTKNHAATITPTVQEPVDVKACLTKMTGPDARGGDMEHHMVAKNLYDLTLIENNHLHFESERDILAEDFIFTLDYFNYVQKVGICQYPGYVYYDNEGTLTTSYRANRFELLNHLNDAVIERLDGRISLDRFKRNYLIVAQRCISQEVRFHRYNEALGRIATILMHPTLKQYARDMKHDESLRSKVMNRLLLGGHRHMLYIIFKLYQLKKGKA